MAKAWVGFFFGLFLTLSCNGERPLRFSLLLEDGAGIRSGCVVVYDGHEIGRVVSVAEEPGKVTVEIEVPAEQRSRLYREARFGTILDGGVDLCLGIQDQDGKRTQIEDGDVIDLRPGWFERLSNQLRQAGDSARTALEELKTGVDEAVESFEQSPEFERFKGQLAEAGRDAAAVARERYQRFVETDLPKLEEKASAYRDKLIKEGRQKEAEIFWKWFQRWADAVKNAGAEEKPVQAEEEPGNS